MSVSQEANHYESKRFGSEQRYNQIREGQRRMRAKNIETEEGINNQLLVSYTIGKKHKNEKHEESCPLLTLEDISKILETDGKGISNEECAILYPACFWGIIHHGENLSKFVRESSPERLQRKRQLQF
jgi:hypothetical protein